MDEPKISVIVPVYNVEPYLRDCLDSIVRQTHRNLEIILVDDGSTDHSGSICDEFAMKDNRIIVIHKANGGLSSARNAGLEIVSGEYISFVDSDDAINPIFLSSLLSSGAEIAQCGYTTDYTRLNFKMSPIFEYLDGFEMSQRLCEEGYLSNTVVWSKLWRKEKYKNLRFPVGRIHEDEFVTWKAFWNAKTIARTESPLYFYRKRPNSIISSEKIEGLFDYFDALRERIDFYRIHNEPKLEDLTKAALCYALNEKMKYLSARMPDKAKSLRSEMKQNYRDVMGSKELDLRKKAVITMQKVCPNTYSYIKTLIKS